MGGGTMVGATGAAGVPGDGGPATMTGRQHLARLGRHLLAVAGGMAGFVAVDALLGTGSVERDLGLILAMSGAVMVVAVAWGLLDRFRRRGRPATTASRPDGLEQGLGFLVSITIYGLARPIYDADSVAGLAVRLGLAIAFLAVAAEAASWVAPAVRAFAATLTGRRARAGVAIPIAVAVGGVLLADLVVGAGSHASFACAAELAADCDRLQPALPYLGWLGWIVVVTAGAGAGALWATGEAMGGQVIAGLSYFGLAGWYGLTVAEATRGHISIALFPFILAAGVALLAVLGAIVAMAWITPTDPRPAPPPTPWPG